jgi:hypothetical protein
MPYKIRIQETRIVALEVNAKLGYTKDQITALVEKRMDGLTLRREARLANYGDDLVDDSGTVIGRYGELQEEKTTREILWDEQSR